MASTEWEPRKWITEHEPEARDYPLGTGNKNEQTIAAAFHFFLFSFAPTKHTQKLSLTDYPRNQQESIAWQRQYFSATWLKFYQLLGEYFEMVT